jgi:cell division transport system permease protein
MRAQFIASEAGIGLRRNLGLTISVIVTFAVSLTFVGIALLLRFQIQEAKSYWYDRVEVSVFLCDKTSDPTACPDGAVTQAQRDSIGSTLEGLPQVEKIYYESKQEAFQHFQEQQGKNSPLVENITADALPESYRIKLKDPRAFSAVDQAVSKLPGVEYVQDQKRLLDRLFNVIDWFSWASAALAAFVGVAAMIMVVTTIRLSAFSRRRETGIMRLVGGSSFYIRLPFLIEGLVAGIVGAAVSSGILAGIEQFLIKDKAQKNFPVVGEGHWIGWVEVVKTMGILFAIGVALSLLASYFTLRKYLRV